MSKLRYFGRKLGALAATAATFCSNSVASLLPKRSNSVATHHCTLHWLLSRLQMPFNGLVGSNSSNTFPNLSQEITSSEGELDYSSLESALAECLREEQEATGYQMDEFDHEDYDEWWDEYDHYDDDRFAGILRHSWEQEAVDEAINEEQEDEYPRTDRYQGDW